MTQEFTLRAMAKNYAGGHSWDHLDGEACIKAADEIARLREALRLAKSDMMTAVRHVEREITFVPPVTEQEHLKDIQARSKCEHVKSLGTPCDAESGGWWTCMCAVAADKAVTEFHRTLSQGQGERGT